MELIDSTIVLQQSSPRRGSEISQKGSWQNILGKHSLLSSQSDNNRSISPQPQQHSPRHNSVCYWSTQPCPALSLVHTTQLGLWLAELAGFVYSGPVLGSVWPSLARGVSVETVIGVTWTLWHLETCTELRHLHITNSHQGELQIRVLEDEAGQDSLCLWRLCVFVARPPVWCRSMGGVDGLTFLQGL